MAQKPKSAAVKTLLAAQFAANPPTRRALAREALLVTPCCPPRRPPPDAPAGLEPGQPCWFKLPACSGRSLDRSTRPNPIQRLPLNADFRLAVHLGKVVLENRFRHINRRKDVGNQTNRQGDRETSDRSCSKKEQEERRHDRRH